MGARFDIKSTGSENVRQLQGCPVAVLGAARSGREVARLLHLAGARVLLSEARPARQVAEQLRHLPEDIEVETGGHSSNILKAHLVVISPGIPLEIPILQKVRRAHIPVVGELEVASWFTRAPIIAITGSNGKTTTTALTGEMFRYQYADVIVGGNIGRPFSGELLKMPRPVFNILEVSSFQLESIHAFHPRAAVITNLSPNHLDRYAGFDAYVRAKLNLLKNMTGDDILLYNADDPMLTAHLRRVVPQQFPFSLKGALDQGSWWQADGIRIRWQELDVEIPIPGMRLRGPHNRYNLLVAATLAALFGVELRHVQQVAETFQGLPHRLEPVGKVGGVLFVNDSKATTVQALEFALQSFQEPLVLIAGGKDKGGDFGALVPLLQQRVKAAVLIGQAARRIQEAWQGYIPLYRCTTLKAAVQQAFRLADAGDVVLLAPACSSFDMFRDYEDRGEQFRRMVQQLEDVAHQETPGDPRPKTEDPHS